MRTSQRKAITKITAIIVVVAIVVVVAVGYLLWSSTTPQPKPTKNEIVIGVALSLTGKYAKSGKWYKMSYELWRDEVNAQGGIYVKEYGKKLPVRLIIYDDASDPEKAVSLYEKLITVDKVDLIFSSYSSAIVYATSAVAEKYHYVYLDCGGVSKKIFSRGFKYIFGVFAGLGWQYAQGLFEWIKTLPADQRPKSIAWFGEDTEFPHDFFDGVKKFADEVGIPIVVYDFYPKGTTDLTPLISKAKAAGAEMLIGGTYFPDAVLFVKTCKELDYSPKIIFLTVGPSMVPDFPDALGDDVNYVWFSAHFMPRPVQPWTKDFVEKFHARYGIDPDYHAAGGWDAAHIMQAAIEATGTLNNTVLRNYIATHEFKVVSGVGKMSWNPDGTPQFHMFTAQYQNGKVEIVWPPDVATAEPIYPMPTWEERAASSAAASSKSEDNNLEKIIIHNISINLDNSVIKTIQYFHVSSIFATNVVSDPLFKSTYS